MTQDEVQMLVSSLPGQAIVINDRFECKFSVPSRGEAYAFTSFTQDPCSHKTSNSYAEADVKDLATHQRMKGMVFLQKHDDLNSHSAMLYVKPFSTASDVSSFIAVDHWTSSFTIVSVEKKDK